MVEIPKDLLMSVTDIGRSEIANSSKTRIGMRQSDFGPASSLRASMGMLLDHFIRAVIAFAVAL